jgi:hypothetical protein
MMISKTFVILATALSATATHVHNQFGKDGYIQDDQGSELALNNGGSVTIGGGWGFFWVDSSVCGKNSVAYTWPSSYGGMLFKSTCRLYWLCKFSIDIYLDVYIRSDGFLYDGSGKCHLPPKLMLKFKTDH